MHEMKLAVPTLTLLFAALAGCAEPAPVPPPGPAAAVVEDQPAQDVPPATAPRSATAALRANGAIGYSGFGPARFGATEQQVLEAWGDGIESSPAAEPGGCRYLLPEPRPQGGYGVG